MFTCCCLVAFKATAVQWLPPGHSSVAHIAFTDTPRTSISNWYKCHQYRAFTNTQYADLWSFCRLPDRHYTAIPHYPTAGFLPNPISLTCVFLSTRLQRQRQNSEFIFLEIHHQAFSLWGCYLLALPEQLCRDRVAH